jgi:peptidoglycan/xylan/chitin deacetylase (PgdA/CDA1 family)
VASLPILMYHNVSPNSNLSVGLTISVDKLEEQILFLKKKNYNFLFASQLEVEQENNSKNIVITFDDVTLNQLEYAYPILKKHNVKATFFIPFSFVGKSDFWNEGYFPEREEIMTVEQLNSLDNSIIELGHHSFFHRKYSELTAEEVQDDLEKSFEFIANNQLNVYPSLAYPYGNFPKDKVKSELFISVLKKNGIKLAFRIGNRLNKLPLSSKYQLQRIDVKGEMSLFKFGFKLKFGKGLF